MSEFGDYLKSKREQKQLSLNEAADIIGITAIQLNNIETGKSKPRSITFGKIVTRLELDTEECLEAYKKE